jgi:hypothetical protein
MGRGHRGTSSLRKTTPLPRAHTSSFYHHVSATALVVAWWPMCPTTETRTRCADGSVVWIPGRERKSKGYMDIVPQRHVGEQVA